MAADGQRLQSEARRPVSPAQRRGDRRRNIQQRRSMVRRGPPLERQRLGRCGPPARRRPHFDRGNAERRYPRRRGYFTHAGGVPANYIARWNAASPWLPLAVGLGDTPSAVWAVPRGDVVATGSFLTAGGHISPYIARWTATLCCADFDGDGSPGTDQDIEAFFACLAGNCCPTCGSADFNGDGDTATDADIEAFFRVLAGGNC